MPARERKSERGIENLCISVNHCHAQPVLLVKCLLKNSFVYVNTKERILTTDLSFAVTYDAHHTVAGVDTQYRCNAEEYKSVG